MFIMSHPLAFPLSIIGILITGFLSNDLYLPSLPSLVHEFKTTDNLMQATMTAWFVGSMSLQLLLGPISDIYGRRPILLGSTVLLVLSSILCVSSDQISMLLLGRLLQGAAVSGLMVAAYAAVYETYSPSETKVTQMFGYIGMSTALAPVVGPIAGGYISTYMGWSMNFYLVAGLAVFLLGVLYHFVPETRLWHPSGTLQRLNWGSVLKDYMALLKNKLFTWSVLTYGFMFFAGGAFITSVAFISVDMLGMQQQHAGLLFAPLIACYMVSAGLTGHLIKHIAQTKVILFSLIAATLSMICFTIASMIFEPSLTLVVIPVGIYYLAVGFAGPPLNNLSLSMTGNAKGTGAALMSFCMMLGCTLGSLIISVAYNGKLAVIAGVLCASIIAALVCYCLFLKHYR
jgi:Bcr/CflA subfamily drug resistance transporter